MTDSLSTPTASHARKSKPRNPNHQHQQQQQQQEAQQQQPHHQRSDSSSSHTSTSSQRGGGGGGGKHRSNGNGASSSSSSSSSSNKQYFPKASHSSSHAAPPIIETSASPAPSAHSNASTPTSSSRFLFHSPPSLFRGHSQIPPTLGPFSLPGAPAPPAHRPKVAFPESYAPVNLLRLIRALTPQWSVEDDDEEEEEVEDGRGQEKQGSDKEKKQQQQNGNNNKQHTNQTNGSTSVPSSSSSSPQSSTFSPSHYPLAKLWSFYDNPYGHEVSLLLDSDSFLNSSPRSIGGRERDDVTEVYFVPYLSALVLYEQSTDAPSPPLLSWFEHVSPHQRLPLIDQITSIGSCFSPPLSSPLYSQFSPFPSKRLLQEVSTSQLDTKRSWYAITWYPILHDPITTPVLAGSFLMWHSFDMNQGFECPMKESGFMKNVESETATAVTPATSEEPDSSAASLSSITEATSNGDSSNGFDSPPSVRSSIFPSTVCRFCGDSHTTNVSFSFLPLLGYLCHRVLPSTWYQAQVQIVETSTMSITPSKRASSSSSSSFVPSSSLSPPPHASNREIISSFNRLLHHSAPTSAAAHNFAHLSAAHQPTKLTHADLTSELHAVLLGMQHPDYTHMTEGKAAQSKVER